MAVVFSSSSNWVVDSRASQHMTIVKSQLVDIVDNSKLNLKVDRPNGSTARVNKIGNIYLSNFMSLLDVFVVPDFHISLLFTHKLCRNNKCQVVFDENKFVVHDSLSKETGNEFGGMYYLNNKYNGRSCFSKYTTCFVSKLIWHNRHGHPTDQALNYLKDLLKFGNDFILPCEVCHKAKQTR